MGARSVALAVVFSILAAACSGGDEASDTSSSTTSSSSTTTTVATTTTAASPTMTTTTTETPSVTLAPSAISVTTGGMGQIRVGMTVAEAEEAVGFTLEGELDPQISEACYHVTAPDDQPDFADVSFMVLDDTIVRVEVHGDSTATTRSGAGIGITEADLNAMFPGQIQPSEGLAGGGTAFQFVPRDDADAEYRVIFIFEGGSVSEYWAGILPAVAFSEGCL